MDIAGADGAITRSVQVSGCALTLHLVGCQPRPRCAGPAPRHRRRRVRGELRARPSRWAVAGGPCCGGHIGPGVGTTVVAGVPGPPSARKGITITANEARRAPQHVGSGEPTPHRPPSADALR